MKAILVLEDGYTCEGIPFGAPLSVAGEVVFNTGMVGYAESMTDPSYAGQILVFTYPLIGNYGIPEGSTTPPSVDGLLQHFESERVHVRGIIVSTLCEKYSHWSALSSLSAWCRRHGVPGLQGVDTRSLTKRLRAKGTMLGKLIVHDEDVPWEDPAERNVVADVSITSPRLYEAAGERKVILVDLGCKENITRSLLRRKLNVLKVPWDYDWTKEEADGVFLSNGPGDPTKCVETIATLRKSFDKGIPIFGICLGHQLMALAGGGSTYKLAFGHRSQNQPCIEVGTKRCYITSQNHGYAVDERSLPSEWAPWFFNANDGTNEGIRHRERTLASVQFHPEAQPGPSDTDHLFDLFAESVQHATQYA
jgi:carbamoyl-phosphate synthase small subunit